MQFWSKELLMGSGGDKKFILNVFYSGVSLFIVFPQKVGSAICSGWVTYNYNDRITGYFYPRLLSVSGVLGTTGSQITADGNWNTQISASFKDEVVVGGFKFLRYRYTFTFWGHSYEGCIFISPNQKVGDVIFSAAAGGAYIVEVTSFTDSSVTYKYVSQDDTERSVTLAATDQNIEYIYRA